MVLRWVFFFCFEGGYVVRILYVGEFGIYCVFSIIVYVEVNIGEGGVSFCF